ncbi:MAG: hypothetical protein ACK559_11170, partial [bacterium]
MPFMSEPTVKPRYTLMVGAKLRVLRPTGTSPTLTMSACSRRSADLAITTSSGEPSPFTSGKVSRLSGWYVPSNKGMDRISEPSAPLRISARRGDCRTTARSG